MPLYVDLVSTSGSPGIATPGIVTAGIPAMDDCNILTRLKAFIVPQGVCATLEHVFRDRQGRPIDLSGWVSDGTSDSLSYSESSSANGTLKVRIKEWLGDCPSPTRNPIWDVAGEAVDAAKGVVRFTLEEEIVEHAGIYEMSFAVMNSDEKPVAVDKGILSVEKSMFPTDLSLVRKDLGPPTLQEIRMRMMDSSRNENLLLDDIEFKDEQILMAMWEPIRLWNESPPPIERYTTRNFPFRGAWIQGVMAQLHLIMANHFRRNTFRGAAGGTSDKDKEREYMAEGTRLWDEYKSWLLTKKVECNIRKFAGQHRSQYSSRAGW